MKTISLGTKKKQFKSIRLAADAAGINYITVYMRLRAGMSPAEALRKPVRAYRRQMAAAETASLAD